MGSLNLLDLRRLVANGHPQSNDLVSLLTRLGQMLMAGFAGDVQTGFRMIDSMREHLEPYADIWIWPRAFALQWRRRGRRIFAAATPACKKRGCLLLLVGTMPPSSKHPWGHSLCVRMTAPDFVPEFQQGFRWMAIGSGSTHKTAETFVNQTFEEFGQGLGKAEVMNPGGTGSMTAFTLTKFLSEKPHLDVSPRLLIGETWFNRMSIHERALITHDGDPPPDEEAPTALGGFDSLTISSQVLAFDVDFALMQLQREIRSRSRFERKVCQNVEDLESTANAMALRHVKNHDWVAFGALPVT